MSTDLTHRVIKNTKDACRHFARYQRRFFDFNQRRGYRGWENWLTVEIGRRLDDSLVIPFCRYLTKLERKHLDLFVTSDPKVAVEIKVNYIDNDEAPETTELPVRVLRDRDKLETLERSIVCLLLVSTCFESQKALRAYRANVSPGLSGAFPGWKTEWHNCSNRNRDGWNLLLTFTRTRGPRHQTSRMVK